MTRRSLTRFGLFLGGALGIGCSVLNTYDGVVPLVVADGGGAEAAAPEASADAALGDTMGDSTAEASVTDAAAEADVVPSEAGDATAREGSTDAIADAGLDTTPEDAGPRGVVVVGGQVQEDSGLQFVLTALDPVTGNELPSARVPMIVSAILYDSGNDVWFVFESGGAGIYPLPTDPFYLHARKIDAASGKWTEMYKALIPTGVSYLTTAMLTNSIAYLAYPSTGASDSGASRVAVPMPFGLVTLDTMAQMGPPSVSVTTLPPGMGTSVLTPIGVTALPSSTNFGGTALLGSVTAGFPGAAQITPYLVAVGGTALEATVDGPSENGASFGAVTINTMSGTTSSFLVATTSSASQTGTLTLFDKLGNLGASGQFPFKDSIIRPPAFSECFQTVFVVGANADTAVHAVALPQAGVTGPDGGPASLTSFSADTGHSGQSVYFEPYTNTVLAPFSQGDNFTLSAFAFDGVRLTPRGSPLWMPPPTLRPNFVATRALPAGMACPTASGG